MPEVKGSQKSTTQTESIEDVNMGDLGFFDEFDKEGNVQPPTAHMPEKIKFGVPAPNMQPMGPATTRPTQTTLNDKNANKFDRVIDGAALLRVTH